MTHLTQAERRCISETLDKKISAANLKMSKCGESQSCYDVT